MSYNKETLTFDHILIEERLRKGLYVAHFLSGLLEEIDNQPPSSQSFITISI
jgi:hypothetical protein